MKFFDNGFLHKEKEYGVFYIYGNLDGNLCNISRENMEIKDYPRIFVFYDLVPVKYDHNRDYNEKLKYGIKKYFINDSNIYEPNTYYQVTNFLALKEKDIYCIINYKVNALVIPYGSPFAKLFNRSNWDIKAKQIAEKEERKIHNLLRHEINHTGIPGYNYKLQLLKLWGFDLDKDIINYIYVYN